MDTTASHRPEPQLKVYFGAASLILAAWYLQSTVFISQSLDILGKATWSSKCYCRYLAAENSEKLLSWMCSWTDRNKNFSGFTSIKICIKYWRIWKEIIFFLLWQSSFICYKVDFISLMRFLNFFCNLSLNGNIFLREAKERRGQKKTNFFLSKSNEVTDIFMYSE